MMLLRNWVITDSRLLVVWLDAQTFLRLCWTRRSKAEDPVILLASDCCHGAFSKCWAGCFQPAGSAVPLASDITKTAIKTLWPSFSAAVFVSAAETGTFVQLAFMSSPNKRGRFSTLGKGQTWRRAWLWLLDHKEASGKTKTNRPGGEMFLRHHDSVGAAPARTTHGHACKVQKTPGCQFT